MHTGVRGPRYTALLSTLFFQGFVFPEVGLMVWCQAAAELHNHIRGVQICDCSQRSEREKSQIFPFNSI